MSYTKKKEILKIIKEIKNKTLSRQKLIENIKKIGEIGDKSFADDIIPLLDELNDKDVISLKEIFKKLGITANFMNQEGIKKEDIKDYDGAIRKYELSIKVDRSHQWAWYNMARMYEKYKHDKEKAIKLYKEAVSIDEEYGDAWNNMGNTYSDLNQFSLARDAYERATKCKGYRYKHFPYFNLGLIYDQVNNLEKALKHFLKSIEIKGTYVKAVYNAGRMYKKLGNNEKASEFFAKTLTLDKTFEREIRKVGVPVEEIITKQIIKKLDNFNPEQKRTHGVRY